MLFKKRKIFLESLKLYNIRIIELLNFFLKLLPVWVTIFSVSLFFSHFSTPQKISDIFTFLSGSEITNPVIKLHTKELLLKVVDVEYFVNIAYYWVMFFWAFLSYFVFIIIQFLTDIFFIISQEKVEKIDYYVLIYGRKIHTLVQPILTKVAILLTFVELLVLLYNKIWILDANESISLFVYIILGLVPFVYLTTWFCFMQIWRKRKDKKLINYYLFSRAMVRRNFKNILDILLFMSFFGRISLPLLLSIYEGIDSFFLQKLIDIEYYNQIRDFLLSSIDQQNIDKYFPPFRELLVQKSIFNIYLLRFQELYLMKRLLNLFLSIIAIVSFSEIFIPTIIWSLIKIKARKQILKIFLSASISFIITFAIDNLISYLYLFDSNSIISSKTIIIFIITFYLVHQDNKKNSEYI